MKITFCFISEDWMLKRMHLLWKKLWQLELRE